MESLNNSFWGLIQTNEDDMEHEIQVETIKRILTSCSEQPVSKSTSLKAVQVTRDNPKRGRYGVNVRSRSAPSTPTPTIKKRRYCSKDSSFNSPRKVHFAEMVDGNAKETSVSRDKGIPESTLTDSLHKAGGNEKLHEQNKENIDYSNMVSPDPKSQQSLVSDQPVNGCDDTDKNKDQARLRFQWAATKGLPAHILVVHLRVPFSQKLMTLKWHKEKKVFQSDKYDSVPIGQHHVTMIVAGREVQVEPLDIKFYTFEADVYLLEEEENKLYQDRHILGQLKASQLSGTHTDSRERIVKQAAKPLKTHTSDNAPPQRISPTKAGVVNSPNSGSVSLGRTTETSTKNSLNVKNQLTNENPIETCNGVSESMPKGFRIPTFNKFSKTNKAKSNKMDEPGTTEGVKSSSGIRRSKIYEKLVKQQLKFKERQPRIGGSLDNLDRESYGKESSLRDTERDYEYRSSKAASSDSYKEPQEEKASSGSEDRYGISSYRESHSRDKERSRDPRSSSMDSRDREHQWSSRNGTESHSSKLTRPGSHYYSSDQELSRYSDYGSHDLAGRRSADLSMRRSNDHFEDIPTVTTGNSRLHKDTKHHDGYRSLDHLSDLGWSSTTEEKYEHDVKSSKQNKESTYYTDNQPLKDHRHYDRRDNRESIDKYFSDSEVRPSRQSYGEDKGRSGFEKGDRYGQQPQIRTPLVTSRTLPLAPKGLDHRQDRSTDHRQDWSTDHRQDQYNDYKQDRSTERPKEERVQDLEDTVLSLKQLLTERDKEMDLLHCEKRKLEVDVREFKEREKTGGTATTLGQGGIVLESQKETEKRINDLIREKENMATEIWQLKRDLDKAAKGQVNHVNDHSVNNEEDHLDTSNARVLHRKIEELESQVKDLQEVNENTAGDLVHTEKELDQLKKENEVLRKTRTRKIIELEDDNARLKQQLERSGSGVSDDIYLRDETDRLREDLRILRDKNHQLVQDNIKLTEHLKDIESRLDIATSRGAGTGQGERSDLVAECQRYRKEREAAIEEVDYLRRELQKSRREGSLNRSLDRDPYQVDVKLRSDESSQNSLSQSVYRSRTTLINGHGEARTKRERKNSGSDLSDSTAVLTTAHPGYHSDNKDMNTTTRKPQEKEVDTSHRFQDAYSSKSISTSHTETIEDVLDDVTPSVPSKDQYRSQLINMVEDVLDNGEIQPVQNIKSSLQNKHKTDPPLVHNRPLAQIKEENQNTSNDALVQDEISDDGQSGLVRRASNHNNADKLPNKSPHKSMLTKRNLQHFDTKNPNNSSLNNSPFSVVSVSSSSSRQFPDSQHTKNHSHISHSSTTSNHQANMVVSGSYNKHCVNGINAVSPTRKNFPTTYQSTTSHSLEETEDVETKPANTSWTLDELSDLEDSVSCVGVNSKPTHHQQTADIHRSSHSQRLHTDHYGDAMEQAISPGLRNKRSNSVSSDCTDFLMTDVERLVQQYSGSGANVEGADRGKSLHRLNQHSMSISNLPTQERHDGDVFQPIEQSSKGSDRLSPSPEHNSSLRSVSPRPITTQHNKHTNSSPVIDEVSLMVANKRPFCPRNPADLHLDDLVKFSRQGGKISRGYVKYIGHLPGKNDTYLGVELEHELGKHDGSYEGYRFFRCKPSKGVFVAFSKVVMAWGS